MCNNIYISIIEKINVEMDFERVAHESIDSSTSQFWRAIAIWMKNPHVVNRRILASQGLLIIEVNCDVLDVFKQTEEIQLDHVKDDLSTENRKHLLDILNISECCLSFPVESHSVEELNSDKVYLYVRKLLPRNTHIFSPTLEFIFVDKRSSSITSFYKRIVCDKQFLGPNVIYNIQHHEYDFVCMNVRKLEERDYGKSCEWLKSKFLPRLMKWMICQNNGVKPKVDSLSLVSVEKYTLLYNRLKEKYGTEMVKVWPENTDAAKFVYEDVAIATYLLLLWEKERLERNTQELQSFVDLGCGNGLLVYILSNEGHAGTGIDLRRRKIWDLYPDNTRLQVRKKFVIIIIYQVNSDCRHYLIV